MMTDPIARGPINDGGALLGRLLLGSIFVWAGFAKAMAASGTIAYFAKMGLPVPPAAYAVSVAIVLGVCLLFVVGLFGRASALVLAVWCIATALAAYSDFADHNMLIHFFKNVAMCCGFIYAALLGLERYSVDTWIAARRTGVSSSPALVR